MCEGWAEGTERAYAAAGPRVAVVDDGAADGVAERGVELVDK